VWPLRGQSLWGALQVNASVVRAFGPSRSGRNMARGEDPLAEEAECFTCWNRFSVRRVRTIGSPAQRAVLSTEWQCPYCGQVIEFDTSVVGVERLQISEPRRLLANLTRRLIISKGDAEVRERERLRAMRRKAGASPEVQGQ